MSPLDRKLLRTLWRMRGQAGAIAMVIALGVTMLVMMTGLVTTLDETRRTYYERYRLADVFAPTARAPHRLLDELAALPGVAAVEGRVTGGALISTRGDGPPIRALAVSLPAQGRPRVNDFYLTDGRVPNGDRGDEILLLQGFAEAHGIRPGVTLQATMNGARRSFSVVGLAKAPEFLYTTAPGELVPDPSRFAVLWMNEDTLEAAFDMKGAFNEALLKLARGARLQSVIDGADRILDAHGGLGSYALADQASNRFISEEISGLRASTAVVPPIFLGVASFLLYIVIARMVQSEREQIGILKAFGYTGFEVGAHYFKFALIVAVAGALIGIALGAVSGRAMAGLYQQYYRFPFLVFRVDPGAFVTGVVISIAAASAGALLVLRSVFALTPAVAMRPPAPADYSAAGMFGPRIAKLLDQPSRMVLRRVMRQPVRMFGAVIGIAMGMALSVGMLGVLAGFDRALDLTFSVIDRSDALVSFVHPMSDKVVYELGRTDGVIAVEPVRVAPATLRHGFRSYRGAVNGLTETARLNRALDADLKPVPLHTDGIVVSVALADVLDITVGDELTVEILEGRRPVLRIPVTGITESLIGSPAFMRLDALNRALKEPERVSGVYLTAAPDVLTRLQKDVADMPSVAGISLKREAESALQTMMDEGAGSTRYIMALIAGVITFGIVYNTARVAFAERSRDLASLRVVGFTKGETAFVLLGELAVVVLAALPLGAVIGYYLTFAISAGFSTDIYQIPTVFAPSVYGSAGLAVLVAALISGLMVSRDVSRLELVSALKIRE